VRKRRNAEETARLLRDADREPAKGLTVSDFCRKVGVAETTYYRWRRRNDPKEVDSERRCRELENEVERLKRLVVELLLDKTMLREVAKKKGADFFRLKSFGYMLCWSRRVNSRRVCRRSRP